MAIKLSLIVPTHNRSALLKISLPSFINQTLSEKFYEIIVVDNNSSDNTKNIVKNLFKKTKCTCVYIFEKHPGLHNARNRGILEARGNIVVFGDDDIIADKNWLKYLLYEFEINKRVGVVGGKIIPKWRKYPEYWMSLFEKNNSNAALAYLNLGNKRKVLTNEHVWGCNYAVRKDIAIKVGGSRPDVFPKVLKHYSGSGEIDLTNAIKKLGYQVIYQPNAIVHHVISKDRLDFSYFIERKKRFAIEQVFVEYRLKSTASNLVKLLKSSIKNYVKISLEYLFTKPKGLQSKSIMLEHVYYSQAIIQIVRVMLSKKLREHITRKSYFSELKS